MTDSGPAATRVAAFFDLDKTIIAKSSTLAFSGPFFRHGLISRRAVLKSGYAQFMLSVAGADAEQTERMRAGITALCAGWDVAQVTRIVDEALHETVDPLVYTEATELIAEHAARNEDVVVVSASGVEIVTPIARKVGAAHSIASRMLVRDGRYTGELDFYCYGEHKAEAARELAARQGYDLARSHAYSDSSTDLPLLESVGHPVVVNPDRALRRVAERRGWPVLRFCGTTARRGRLRCLPAPAVATAAGFAAVVAGGAWFDRRRRHR